ncbi:2Fe-2S iron-sulfur cluster-binding protein [Gordonia sp. N1V]|uniref:2Fe-2S iron-sulfur cluster-binding protein n=1 Tax=Gordonia sp. N1V TaxID=3034163 RepID=UPI0023E2FDD1|nr:2Fe-2S iron-sulfur cluster-binding protein [Gordonia sp. N1V]MDF3280700.1 2Fe-2S iron-sulfur cluster-binding protein [Gordonia sp. N1V]
MSGRLLPTDDPIGRTDETITVTVDGATLHGITGQTLAGVLLGNGITAWRTAGDGTPRGLFCGIGACFDCVATVNGHSDVRLCRTSRRRR